MIKGFFNQVYVHRYEEFISESKLKLLWSITNGLLPAGAAVGALFSGLSADFFGRF